MPEESTSRELFPLSIVILTKNEEDHLQDCLESCQWAEDILVVDSGSRDRTVEIARSFGAYVIHQGWMGFGPQRRFAVSQAAHDWVPAAALTPHRTCMNLPGRPGSSAVF